MTGDAVLLMVLLLVGHYLGDFTPLATRKMLEAKSGAAGPGYIFAHAAVHGALVLAAVAAVRTGWTIALAAAGIELATHAAIDFAKMRLGQRHPVLRDPGGGPFWHLHGFDQLVHLLILVGIAAYAL